MIKVLIVDDQEIIRDSLRLILGADPQLEVVGCAENGRQAVQLTKKYKPDVILMDIRMPDLDGLECTKIIKRLYTNIKVIILTTFDDDEYVYKSIKNGVNGFLLKGISKNELIKSIVTVYNGGATLEPYIANKVLSLFGKMAKSYVVDSTNDVNIESLSCNELKIIQLIGRGLSNKEIMEEINFSEGTIRNYISSILRKLDLSNRTQVAIFAIQSGIMLKDFGERE